MTERSFEPDPPALDPAATRRFASPELFAGEASAFLAAAPQLLADLAAAVGAGDHARAADLARQLRVGGEPLGAAALAGACARLEAGPPQAIAGLSLAVSVEYRRAATALKALLG